MREHVEEDPGKKAAELQQSHHRFLCPSLQAVTLNLSMWLISPPM